MENMRTEELRKHKASIKSKLMAAIAMLLVSTIMLSSTTYAWFVLSTAPEVTGMATAVGSNGSLEIALLNNETGADVNKITSGVGDSSAKQGVYEANETWGNIVDLSDSTYYGMDLVKLYPAALNMAEGSTTNLTNVYQILKTPSYGVDGRVAKLEANTLAAKYTNSTFAASASDYGFRAIGTYTSADPVASALANAKLGFTNGVNAAKANILSGNVAKGLTTYLMSHALEMAGNDAQGMSITVTEISAIGEALQSLNQAATNIETAIKNGIAAKQIAATNQAVNVSAIKLDDYANDDDFKGVIAELNALKSGIADAEADYQDVLDAHTGTTYAWSEYSAVLNKIVGSDLKIDGYTFDQINDLPNKTQWAAGLVSAAKIEVNSGLMNDAANMVGSTTSSKFTVVITEDDPNTTDDDEFMGLEDATMTVNCTVLDADSKETPSMVVLNTNKVSTYALTGENTGNAADVLNNYYGYIIDLAFRASTDTNLLLSEAVNRVNSDTTTDTQGKGTTFTVNTGDIADLSALRIVFIDTDTYEILGVAGVSDTPITEGGKEYAVHMYDYTVDSVNGGITLNAVKTTTPEGATEAVADDSVTELLAGVARKISVLVYLDGNHVASALDAVTGTLNLQFASSAPLTAMDYTGYLKPVTPTTEPTEAP